MFAFICPITEPAVAAPTPAAAVNPTALTCKFNQAPRATFLRVRVLAWVRVRCVITGGSAYLMCCCSSS